MRRLLLGIYLSCCEFSSYEFVVNANRYHSYISYASFAAVAVHMQRKQAANKSERLGSEGYELETAKTA